MYTLHAEASTNYILVSILKYLLDFTSLQVKSYKQLQVYKKFQIEYRSIYFRSGIMVYSNTCNL